MWSLLIKVVRDIGRRRLRSILTTLGVAVGVAGLVAIVSTSRNLARDQRALFDSSSQADLTYWVWNAPKSLVPLLEADPRIAAAELRTTLVARWRTDGPWMDIEFVGIDDFGQVQVNRFEVVEGRFPTYGELMLDISGRRAAGPIAPGSEVSYRDQDGRERTVRISGFSQSPSYLSSTITKVATGYVPATFLRPLLGVSGSNQLLVRLRDARDTRRVVARVARLFRRHELQAGSPEIRDPTQFPGKRELDALVVIMYLFSGMGLVLSSFLVVNTLAATIAEQTGEIGVLKTLGVTGPQITFVYLLEALAYGALGTALGMCLGVLLGWRLLAWIGSLGNATVTFSLANEALLLGTAVGLGVAALGGAIPAHRAAQITVRAALSSYGVRSDYGASRLDRGLQRLTRMPPLAAMALRNLGRRPGRSVLTLLVIALATAAFLGAVSTRDSVDAAISDIYSTYAADAWVWLDRNVSTQVEDFFLTVDGVTAAEGWTLANGHVGLAEARLWGIPPNSSLYRHVLREGRWYRPDEPDEVVLSTRLAEEQQLQVGDRVVIQVRGRARSFRIVGVAIDNTIFLGSTLAGKAFLPRATLGRLLDEQDLVSLFALGFGSREPLVAERILAKVEEKFKRWKPRVQPVYAEIESAREGSRLLALALVAMLIIVALVGSLGILNTLTLNVLERRREIAVLRALGATNADLALSFMVEGMALGAVGWFIGLALGYPWGRLFTRQLGRVLFSLDFVFSLKVVTASLFFTLGLAALASLGPALGAAHARAGAGLRYE